SQADRCSSAFDGALLQLSYAGAVPLLKRSWLRGAALIWCAAVVCGCTFGSRQHPTHADSVSPPPTPDAPAESRRLRADRDAQSVLMRAPPVAREDAERRRDRADVERPRCASGAQPTRTAGSWRWTGVEYRWSPPRWECSDQAWRR